MDDTYQTTARGIAALREYIEEVDNGNLECIKYGGDHWPSIRAGWLAVITAAEDRQQERELVHLEQEQRIYSDNVSDLVDAARARSRILEDISRVNLTDPVKARQMIDDFKAKYNA